MEEPLATGLTTRGSRAEATRPSMSSARTSTIFQPGVFTTSATRRLVRSLSMAMALPRYPAPV